MLHIARIASQAEATAPLSQKQKWKALRINVLHDVHSFCFALFGGPGYASDSTQMFGGPVYASDYTQLFRGPVYASDYANSSGARCTHRTTRTVRGPGVRIGLRQLSGGALYASEDRNC